MKSYWLFMIFMMLVVIAQYLNIIHTSLVNLNDTQQNMVNAISNLK